MDTILKLQEISRRLDQLDQSGEWLEQCLEQSDPALAQTGAMISALAADVQQRLLELVSGLEAQIASAGEELITTDPDNTLH